jgi:hypothetical protein
MSTVAIIPAGTQGGRRPVIHYTDEPENESFRTVASVVDTDNNWYWIDRIPYAGSQIAGVAESEETVSGKGLFYRIAHKEFPSRSRNAMARIDAVRAGSKQDSNDTLVILTLASDPQLVPDDRLEEPLLLYFLEQARAKGFRKVVVNPHGQKDWPSFPGCFSSGFWQDAGFRLEDGVWVKNLFSAFA